MNLQGSNQKSGAGYFALEKILMNFFSSSDRTPYDSSDFEAL